MTYFDSVILNLFQDLPFFFFILFPLVEGEARYEPGGVVF